MTGEQRRKLQIKALLRDNFTLMTLIQPNFYKDGSTKVSVIWRNNSRGTHEVLESQPYSDVIAAMEIPYILLGEESPHISQEDVRNWCMRRVIDDIGLPRSLHAKALEKYCGIDIDKEE